MDILDYHCRCDVCLCSPATVDVEWVNPSAEETGALQVCEKCANHIAGRTLSTIQTDCDQLLYLDWKDSCATMAAVN